MLVPTTATNGCKVITVMLKQKKRKEEDEEKRERRWNACIIYKRAVYSLELFEWPDNSLGTRPIRTTSINNI